MEACPSSSDVAGEQERGARVAETVEPESLRESEAAWVLLEHPDDPVAA
jgi:hypothetical protein